MPTDRSSLIAQLHRGLTSGHRSARGAVPVADPWARYDLLLDDALRSQPGPDFESRVRALHGMRLLLEERHGARRGGVADLPLSREELIAELRELPRDVLLEALGGGDRRGRVLELRERARAAGL